jgi:Flp pilus assembly protein TadG
VRKIRNEDGQTVVEFTLMLPFLLFLFFAIAEFGYGFYTQIAVRNAAAEAARFAAVGNLPSATCAAGSIENRARQASNNVVPCSAVTAGYHTLIDGAYRRGSGVAVRINHQYQAITPLPAIAALISWGVVPTTWNLTACADARLEIAPSLPSNPPPPTASSCG